MKIKQKGKKKKNIKSPKRVKHVEKHMTSRVCAKNQPNLESEEYFCP
jgi:hypothetical protein